MTEKQPLSSNNRDAQKDDYLIAKKILRGGLAFSFLVGPSIAAVRYTYEIPEPTFDKVTGALGRHAIDRYYVISQQDDCPPASDPADLKPLYESIVYAHDTDDAEDVAQRYNMELMDVDALSDTFVGIDEALSHHEVTEVVNTFMQQQINTRIHADEVHEKSAISLDNYKHRIGVFLLIMRTLPIDLLKKIELEDIIIRSEDFEQTGKAGEYLNTTKQVHLSTNALDSPATVIHEIVGHAVHDKVCQGSYYNDRAFTAFNSSDYQYSGDQYKDTAIDPYKHATDYSTKNVLEDYAETTEEFLLGKIEPNLIGIQSSLDKKVGLVIDRLNKLSPGSVEYMNTMAPRLSRYQEIFINRINNDAAKKAGK